MFRSDNVHTYKETQRVSFYFVVTHPTDSAKIIQKSEVEAAIRWDYTHTQLYSL